MVAPLEIATELVVRASGSVLLVIAAVDVVDGRRNRILMNVEDQ